MNNARVLSMRVDEETYTQLEALAAARKMTPSMLGRELVGRGLDACILDDQQQLIKSLVRVAVDQAIQPIGKRLASIASKSAMSSGTATYMIMLYFTHAMGMDEEAVMEYYDEAKKQAYKFLRNAKLDVPEGEEE